MSLLQNFSSYSYAEHKYPYDWRTKKPTIFRATEQWFASVEGFRQAAMEAIGNVKWIPPQVMDLKGLMLLILHCSLVDDFYVSSGHYIFLICL